MKNLVIVESPAKAKTIMKFLGKEFTVQASMGHLVDLPKKKLGIDIEDNFKPTYKTIRGKGKILKELKKASKKADQIYLAPDPDREGEAIAWHIKNKLGLKNAKRITFNAITKSEVKKALENSTDIDMNKVDAQQARRILDRLVGYQVSPILWSTVAKGLSAGRVQTVALRIICEREREIEAFDPEEYWSIDAELQTDKDDTFIASLFKIDKKKFKIGNKEEADKILDDLKAAQYQIETIKKRKKKRNPYAPFITSTLQQDAASKLGFSPKKTMMLAQQLYEGLELKDEGSVGLITYMRTDSTRIAPEALDQARNLIKEEFGEDYLPKKPKLYSPKKGSQDAHETIRPTYLDKTADSIRKNLTKDQYKLYDLIWRRFVACQMNPAIYDSTTVDISAGERYWFRANGSIMRFDGFTAVYPIGGKSDDKKLLPELNEQEILKLLELKPEQHFTQPPPRYSEATLVKELESQGIGRPSTYAAIISTILSRDYIRMDEKRLVPTKLGFTVSDLLVKAFPDIFEVQFTARMEDELDKVESGKEKLEEILTRFYTPFSKDLEEVKKKKKEIKESLQEVTEFKCEKCGSPLVKKWGRNGQFLACSAYPDCKFTRPLPGDEVKDIETDEVCEKCGSPMVIKTGRYGRFMACSGYPKCKNTKPIGLGIDCPKEDCDGEIVERYSRKRRKLFYGCSNYPDCNFAVWDKPVEQECPNCGASFMVKKVTKTHGPNLYCRQCKHRIKLDEDE